MAPYPYQSTSTPPLRRPFDRVLLYFVAAVGAVGLLILLVIPHFYIAAEDAIILFQFSRNLAENGAITYIPHGPHAEGATDFLWMVLIAAGMKLGFDPYWFVAFLNVGSLLAIGAVLLRMAREHLRLLPVLLIAGWFTLLPQFSAADIGFSTLPFALLLVLLTGAFLREDDVWAPLLSLLLCLFRPDGVVFAVPFLAAALVVYPRRGRRFVLDLLLFVVPGLLYFFWRWHYFGQLLPLPFYVKSDTVRLFHLIVPDNVKLLAPMWLAAAAVLWVALRGRFRSTPNLAVTLCLLVLPNLFYISMRLDQNVGLRFFIYMPVGVAVLLAMNWPFIRENRAPTLLRVSLLAWLLLLFPRAEMEAHGSWGGQFVNRKAIAEDLEPIPHGILLSTEAGIAPYYSRWPAYDTWGLSTEQFSHHLIQPEDVARVHPDLIQAHPDVQPRCVLDPAWQVPAHERSWPNMAHNLIAGIDPAQYDLWIAPLGTMNFHLTHDTSRLNGSDYECWFVRKDAPARAAIEDDLRRHDALTLEQYRTDLARANSGSSNQPTGLMDRLKAAWHKFS